MIDLTYDYQSNACECGNPGCDYDESLPISEQQAIVDEYLLNSPILKLVKERDEARRMCELLAAALPDLVAVKTSQKACDAANAEMHQALMTYVKARKLWEGMWK